MIEANVWKQDWQQNIFSDSDFLGDFCNIFWSVEGWFCAHLRGLGNIFKSNTTQSNRKLSGWFLNKIGFHNPLFAFLWTWQAIEINKSSLILNYFLFKYQSLYEVIQLYEQINEIFMMLTNSLRILWTVVMTKLW